MNRNYLGYYQPLIRHHRWLWCFSWIRCWLWNQNHLASLHLFLGKFPNFLLFFLGRPNDQHFARQKCILFQLWKKIFWPATLKTSLGKFSSRFKIFILAQRPPKVCSFDSSSKMRKVTFFIFKKGPPQHRNFSKNFQKFEIFWKISRKNFFFPKIILEANIMQGYKKITPPKSGLKLRYCASDLLSHVNFALSRKKNFSIFLLTIVPKFFWNFTDDFK